MEFKSIEANWFNRRVPNGTERIREKNGDENFSPLHLILRVPVFAQWLKNSCKTLAAKMPE